jgi:hypothetical protein
MPSSDEFLDALGLTSRSETPTLQIRIALFQGSGWYKSARRRRR